MRKTILIILTLAFPSIVFSEEAKLSKEDGYKIRALNAERQMHKERMGRLQVEISLSRIQYDLKISEIQSVVAIATKNSHVDPKKCYPDIKDFKWRDKKGKICELKMEAPDETDTTK